MNPEKEPASNIEKKESVEDNARKFTLGEISPEFLKEKNASSFFLTVNWMKVAEASEIKVARKEFTNGEVQILLISKLIKDGSRISEKKKINEDEYREMLRSSVLHLQKTRHEFKYVQGNITFTLKYDVFEDGNTNMLEVDADSEELRSQFKIKDFPFTLSEVTGNMDYYGYKVAKTLTQ